MFKVVDLKSIKSDECQSCNVAFGGVVQFCPFCGTKHVTTVATSVLQPDIVTTTKKLMTQPVSEPQSPSLVVPQYMHDSVPEMASKPMKALQSESFPLSPKPSAEPSHLSGLLKEQVNARAVPPIPSVNSSTLLATEPLNPIVIEPKWPRKFIFGLLVIGLLGGGYFYMNGKSRSNTVTAVDKVVASQSPGPNAKVATKADLGQSPGPIAEVATKADLNVVVGLANEGHWSDVDTKIHDIERMRAVKITGDRKVARAANDAGLKKLQANDLIGAIADFQTAAAADPSDVEVKNNLGFAQLRQRLFEPALKSLVEALLLAPDRGSAWLNAAEAFAETDSTSAATASLRLGVYLAKNKSKAIEFLKSGAPNIPSDRFRNLIDSNMGVLEGLPEYNRGGGK